MHFGTTVRRHISAYTHDGHKEEGESCSYICAFCTRIGMTRLAPPLLSVIGRSGFFRLPACCHSPLSISAAAIAEKRVKTYHFFHIFSISIPETTVRVSTAVCIYHLNSKIFCSFVFKNFADRSGDKRLHGKMLPTDKHSA